MGRETVKQLSPELDEAHIVDQIFQSVLSHRLKPGTKLTETDLCNLFGVSRMRVRRALLLLSSRGIVELHAHKGAFIAAYSPEQAVEIFEARLVLETAIVAQLSRLCAIASDDVLASHQLVLETHIAKEDSARKTANETEQVRLSGLFHVELTRRLGNQQLNDMVTDLVTRSSLIVARYGVTTNSSCNEGEHRLLLQAILEGDSRKATSLITDHLTHIQRSLIFQEKSAKPSVLAQLITP